MTKVFVVIVAMLFITLAVITAVERVSSPRVALAKIETRADRRKKGRT